MGSPPRFLIHIVIFSVFVSAASISDILYAQQSPSAAEQLVNSLMELKSEKDQTALLLQNKILITPELRKTLSAKAEESKIKGQYPEALNLYALVRKVADQLNDKVAIAEAVNNIGEVYRVLGKYDLALAHYDEALKLSEPIDNKSGIVEALENKGKISVLRGNYKEALEHLNKSLQLSRLVGDKLATASILNILGLAQDGIGNASEALESFKESVKLYEEINHKGAAISMNNIARLLLLHGDYDAARSYLEKTLILFNESGEKTHIGSTWMNIGNLYEAQGNYRLALLNFLKSLEILQEIGDQRGATDALANMAGLYLIQGNYDLALQTYEKSLKQYESLGNKPRVAVVMSSIGSIYSLQDKNDLAIRFLNESLAIKNEIGDIEGKAITLTEIGGIYGSAKKYSLAMESYEKSLEISERMNDVERIARVTLLMAKDYHSMGNHVLSLKHAERSYDAAKKIPNLDLIWQARTISGNAFLAQGDLTNARKSFDEAISTIEALRFQVAGGEQETQRFFELRTAPYYAMVKVLVNQNKINEALNYAERAKARVIFDILQSGKVNVTKAMTAEEEQQEKKLNLELASINKQIYKENLNEKPDPIILSNLRLSLDKLRLSQDAFRTALYAAHPELQAQRGEVPAMNLERAADLLPDDSSALIEFVVTDDETYLFVLTHADSVTAESENSPSPPIELKVYPLPIREQALADRIERFRNELATRIGYRNSARDLFDVLIKPAQVDIKDKTALVIVPDGPLWQLPFQALLMTTDRYVVEDYAISLSPSLSVLHEMTQFKKQNADSNPLERLFAFGNPAFGKSAVEQMKWNYRGEKLGPLPEAENEVKSVAKLYGPESKVFIGPNAHEERIKAEGGNCDVMHMATHGIFDDTSPMYSHLVLSQSSDTSDEDGLLEAWEIMKMDLRADIAVLSACETARGKIGSGEGVIGLTWAFFVAGCPTTIVSQWEVESESTSDLMRAFHVNLKKSGFTAAKALQQAELKLLKSSNYRHPFYWSAFVVIGAGF